MTTTHRAPFASAQHVALWLILLSLGSGFIVVIEPGPTDLFFAAGLGVLMLAIGLRFEITADTRLFHALFFAFAVLNVVSLVVATSVSFGLRYFIITLYLLMIPLAFTHFSVVFGKRALDALYVAFLTGTVLSGLVGTAALAGVAPGPVDLYFRSGDGLRLSPLFKDPNVYGPYMAAGGFLMLGRAFLSAGGHRKVILFGLSFFVLAIMLMTFSRGAWVNSAAISAVFLILVGLYTRTIGEMKWLLVILAFFAALVMFGLPLVLEATGMSAFFESRAQIQYYDTDRFSNWVTAYNVMIREPLGIGPGHFVRVADFPQSEFDLDPHNIILKVFVENGWLGGIAFFGAIGLVMLRLFRTFGYNDERKLLRIMVFAILAGQMVNSMVVDSLHWRHLFVLLGFACGELVIARRARR